MGFADYTQYKITVANGMDIALEEMQEIIISQLSDMPFESFEMENEYILAYVQTNLDEENLMSLINEMEGVAHTEKQVIKGQNWNKIWEESFDPITINNDVMVRAPFHHVDNKYRFEIIIEPKMSFGTGHHSTTRLMMESMLHLNFKNKTVLDMGCGTGILAILAHQLGAAKCTAVDNDPICVESTLENSALNNCLGMVVCLNEKISANFKTDIILANIQRNVLIEQMSSYKSWLNANGTLLVSGIYEEAVKDVVEVAEKNGLKYIDHRKLNDWCMIQFGN